MLNKDKINSAKTTAINSTKKTMQVIGAHLNDVSKADAESYKISATNAGMFGLISLLTSLRGDQLSAYIALTCSAFEAYAALNQYNGENAAVLAVKSAVAKPFQVSTGIYSMFVNKTTNQATQPAADVVESNTETNDSQLRKRAALN